VEKVVGIQEIEVCKVSGRVFHGIYLESKR